MTTKGFSGLKCIECDAADEVHATLNDTSSLYCGACGATYTTTDVKTHLAKVAAQWMKVITWLDSAPKAD